jgi:hypothetical protein
METSIQQQVNGGIEVVNAQLNYLAEATPKPVNYAYDPPAGVPRSSGKHVAQSVAIRNGREVLDKLSLDTNGLVLTPHETAVRDFYDSEEVKSVYYPEVERLLKRVTGAERVLIFDHVVRNPVLADAVKRALALRPRSCTTTIASNPGRAASAIFCRRKLIACSRIASPKSTSGVRFAARSKVRLSRCATPAACVRRMSCPVIWPIASGWAKPTASPTTRNIAGTISRDWNVTKQSC